MRLSKTIFLVPVASLALGFAAAVGAGACGDNDDDVTIPTSSPPPNGVTFAGGEFDGPCQFNVYAIAGTGYAFCDDGTWKYTTTDPAADNFTPFMADSDAGPDIDGSVADGAQGDDATRIEETGPAEDGAPQDSGDHDGGQSHGGDDGGQQ